MGRDPQRVGKRGGDPRADLHRHLPRIVVNGQCVPVKHAPAVLHTPFVIPL